MNQATHSPSRATGLISTRKVVTVGLLAAMAFVLTFLKFPVKFIGFLELEVSDVPAVIAGLCYGPVVGICVELIKNILHLVTTSTAAVGELANFLISSSFVIAVSLVYRFGKGKHKLLIGLVTATIAMTIAGAVVNYLITIPLYIQLFFGGNSEELYKIAGLMVPAITDIRSIIIFGFIPFNLVKGAVVSIVSYYVFKIAGPRIHS